MALAAGLSGTEDAGEREALCALLRELDRPDLSPETLAEGLSSWTIRIKSSGPSPERKEKPGFRNRLNRLLHPPRTPNPEPMDPAEDWLLFAPPDGPKDGSSRQIRVLTVRRTGVSVTLDDEPLVAGSDGDVAEILLPDNPDAAREHSGLPGTRPLLCGRPQHGSWNLPQRRADPHVGTGTAGTGGYHPHRRGRNRLFRTVSRIKTRQENNVATLFSCLF